jgi:3-hydroxy-9,10-secoandrosta-1,3,5(10)-triene-9,17-dione monooxygenase
MSIDSQPSAASAGSSAAVGSAEELVARAAELVPLLRKNANEGEANRVVNAENIEALRAAGLMKLATPKRFGGYECDLNTIIDVLSELGRGCGSTAWVATLINGVNMIAGTMSEQVQLDIWGSDPEAGCCGVFSPGGPPSRAVAGGQVVSGAWGFASGYPFAQWAVLAHEKTDTAGNVTDQVVSAIPMSELTVKDTWFVAGMAATASNTLVADEVFVPDHRMMSVGAAIQGDVPTPFHDEALYHCALGPVLGLILVGSQLGMVRAAIEHTHKSLSKGRAISYTFYTDSRQSPSSQAAIVGAQHNLDVATLLVRRGAGALDAAAKAGTFPSVVERARGRVDAGAAVEYLRAAMQHLLNLNGAGSFAQVNLLQRLWRDLETASRHAVLNSGIAREAYGRALMGIDEQITPIL